MLRRTIDDLAALYPSLTSVAVVPVVFTELHNYKDRMTAVTPAFARDLIREMRPVQRAFRDKLGSTFVYLADEFYLRAGLPLPGRAHYGDYPQIEDGVGMVRRFVMDAKAMLRRDLAALRALTPGALDGTVVTGQLFEPILTRYVAQLNERFGTRLKTVALANQFFGEEVTVAGLLGGGDVLRARDRIEGRFVIVPEQACLKSGHVFLDDLTLDDLERELGVPVAHGGPRLATLIERARQLEARALTGVFAV